MRKLGFSIVAAVVVSMALATPAAASPPAIASGSFVTLTFDETLTKVSDGNQFFTAVDTGLYSGGLSGIDNDSFTEVIHKDGSFEARGSEGCTGCTIGSRTGSFSAVFVFTGQGNTFEGSLTFTGGTGGLAGLHGGGKFAGDIAANTETFAFRFLFAP